MGGASEPSVVVRHPVTGLGALLREAPVLLPLLLAALADEPAPLPLQPARELVLVEVGKGGRRPLRVGSEPGAWQVQVRRTASSTLPGPDGAPLREEAPEAVTVLDGPIEGDVRLRLLRADVVGLDVLTLATIDREVSSADGLAFVLRADPLQRAPWEIHGLPEDAGEALGEVVADVAWALGLSRVPFPEEKVGLGASWTWLRASDLEGLAIEERWTATLARRDRRGVVVKLAVTATGEPSTIGAYTVERLQLSGTGTVWIHPDRPLPTGADLTVQATLALAWEEDDGPRVAEGTLDSHVVLASRPSPASVSAATPQEVP